MNKIILFLWLVAIVACNAPHGEGRRFWVRLQIPENSVLPSPEGTEVRLINNDNGTIYTATADATGMVALDVEYGIYRLTAQLVRNESNTQHLFNAGQENLHLTTTAGISNDTLTILLTYSPLSILIIKEIYYAGCLDNNGKSYIRDAYVSIYNNSQKTVWLDSLCIGTVAPVNAVQPSNWLKYADSIIPISLAAWQIPGSGHDHPLLPGKETVIAVNAVNHTGKDYNHPNSVDLSHVDWGFYHTSLSNNDIAAGVTPLHLFWKTGISQGYAFAIKGPCIVLFRIPGRTADEYAGYPGNILQEPHSVSSSKYLVFPREWVLDCVDCVPDATKRGCKRVHSSLDAEPTFLPSGTYSSRSLHRKQTGTVDGQIVYQDTNNSMDDFEEKIAGAELRNKK